MSIGGHSIRAFRPSRFTRQEEYDERAMWEKQAKVEFYASRAQAGLPLFDEPADGAASQPPHEEPRTS